MLEAWHKKMRTRSIALLLVLDNRLDRILQGWLLIAGFIAAARIGLTPQTAPIAGMTTVASYLLIVVAPFASTLLALHWFRDGHLQPQPSTRLAVLGRWQNVTSFEAEQHHLYGCSGIMASLLLGMMLNVPVRAAEYFAAMPPIGSAAPGWLSALHFALTIDAVLFGSLYMVAFVAALRRVPLFPRLLLAIWIADISMQLCTAYLVTRSGDLPPNVAVALQSLLQGNVKKVLISAGLWLPYLMLSTRVNVTFRHRVPA
ncbi:MAG TPA: DUF2569 family protein [Sphingomicrobium sp.]|nr:DUF2569 family protein [Sphingomicrobium sp.]